MLAADEGTFSRWRTGGEEDSNPGAGRMTGHLGAQEEEQARSCWA